MAVSAHTQAIPVYDIKSDISRMGPSIKSTQYGIFFEDINFAADGGLYAELIKNRSFEFPQPFLGWYTFGNVSLQKDNAPFERCPHYVRLTQVSHSHRKTGLENEGFRGMGWEKGKVCRFSVWARTIENNITPKIQIHLLNEQNTPVVQKDLTIDKGDKWTKYTVDLIPSETVNKGRFRLFLNSPGSVDLDHLSLFPGDTWEKRENGLRADLVQALKNLKPGVFRFPGGCIVEGTELSSRYNWKDSTGPVENRPLNENRWNFTRKDRFCSDYYQSYGLGFYEYFLLAEDLGAEPLPVVNCGMACQYQNDSRAHAPVDQLDAYIQDALDLIEFANGAPDTQWGGIRAKMGHPEPFHLKFIAIGNEQWGHEYTERLEQFVQVFRKKHPEIKIIGSSGPSSSGKEFDSLWKDMKRLNVDLVDEHYYSSPDWFRNNAARYDTYPRTGPKVFAGEYACHAPGTPNSFLSALHEAAFMTGLERNADIVHMATYAPLFAHKNAWQWKPDLIWFDNLSHVLTPNYYVQQLYGKNAGSRVLPLTRENNVPLTGQNHLYGSAVIDDGKNEIIIKLVNLDSSACKINLTLEGEKTTALSTSATGTLLHSENPEAQNTFDSPACIVPQQAASFDIKKGKGSFVLPPSSFSVYTIPRQTEKSTQAVP